ncbi:hypothetical protein Deipe_2669 [Deinococcus peraridilitoris DSM 19664]|uniref:DinB family protein n=1 Tax=Deinococcus peraridilitoris (strain DSM 19664 / LMG 22246 / CIP 109416 / KR-200) TaxID=937777 RepID=L0A3Z1_DEIPD|nr:hypothetical protein Deipe_2669 [Deinococcus peraridilitoris DSM 19664]
MIQPEKPSGTLNLVWRTNAEVNDRLLAHLTPEMLPAVTPGGGFLVAQHLAHMAEVTKCWTSLLDQDAVRDVPDLYETQAQEFVAETDLSRTWEVLGRTRNATWQALQEARGVGNLPHAPTAQFLTHLLVHDAHHRGQILLALKVSGHPLPADEALWAPWRDAR